MSINFNLLDKALKKMGGELMHFPIEKIKSDEKISLEKLKEGVVIERKDFENIEMNAGVFSWKNEHAFLYINEPYADEFDLKESPSENGPKYHLLKCKTIEKMHKDGRSERYVLIQAKDGKFPCHPRNRDINDSNYNKTLYDITIKSDLLVCYNCLTSLNYQNFKSFQHEKKRSYIRSFDIPQFLEYFRPFFFDLKYYRNNNIKTGNYTADHSKIRSQLIDKTGGCCQNEDCKVNLSDQHGWLHLHHVNGQRGDNRDSNIKLLCVVCHQNQPLHQKMKVPTKARIEITKRRRKN